MTFTRLWAFLAIGLPVLAAVIAPFPSVDLTYHLRAGGMMLDTGSLIHEDTFTFTVAGRTWQDQQWLAQLVLAFAYRLGGWTGLTFLRMALVGVTFGFLFDLCRRRAGSIRLAAWLTLAAFVCSAVTLGLRPQLFGIALFSVSLWLIARRDEAPKLVWSVLICEVLWANTHGSFVLGPVLAGLALVEDVAIRRRGRWRSVQLLFWTLFATLVNPFWALIWTYASGISTNPVIAKRITEWQPTSPFTAEGAVFFVSVVVAAAVVVRAWRRDGPPWAALLWLVPFAALGAWAVRGLAWWPLVAAATLAPLVAGPVGRAVPDRPERPDLRIVRRVNGAIAGVLVAAGIAGLPLWRPIDRGLGAPVLVVSAAPSGITGALRGIVRPGDRIYAPQPWGSWFEFAFPQATVAVDSRIELFPDSVWDAVDGVDAGAAGWLTTLEGWDVRIVVASARQDELVGRLRAVGWRLAFADEDGSVYVRQA